MPRSPRAWTEALYAAVSARMESLAYGAPRILQVNENRPREIRDPRRVKDIEHDGKNVIKPP